MKHYISNETDSVLAIIDGELMFAPMSADNTFDTDNFWPVDEVTTGGELVSGYADERKTLSDIYRKAKKALA